MNKGSWWRGRVMPYDSDRQAVELERQRWVEERLSGEAEVISDLAVDPGAEYARWRGEYERTGDDLALAMMLSYVTSPGARSLLASWYVLERAQGNASPVAAGAQAVDCGRGRGVRPVGECVGDGAVVGAQAES